MEPSESERRLAAILMADVVGYGRLMGDDHEATVVALTDSRRMFASQIEAHRGRVVNAPGDSILAEFGSVVDAVACAVEVLRALAERNAELPDDRRMEFRIGINLGDILVSEGALYGDGVNIAARLESMAEPGGIRISGTAFDQVENRLPLEYQSLGEHQVKNIEKPVRVYRVLSVPGAAAHRVMAAKSTIARSWRRVALVAGAVAAVVVVAAAAWQIGRQADDNEPGATTESALPIPENPSIAVLPFVNMSGDPDQDWLGDGIAETIITDLYKLQNLFVIARNSSFTYKGKAVDVT